ncbi:MAG: YfiR/HmsC family protein [Thalassotalea sp.]|nr:YfiR/HmsC family protein [Thalassotalea sp.]
MAAKFYQLMSRCLLVLLNIGLLMGNQAWAQAALVDKEKSIIVSKFAKYSTWQQESALTTFTIGVFNDVEKFLYFSNMYKNKGVKGKDIVVKLVKTSREASDVNILYIPSPNTRKAQNAASNVLKKSNTLIITEGAKDLTNSMVDLSYSNKNENIDLKVIDENIASSGVTIPPLSEVLNGAEEDVLEIGPTFALKSQQDSQLRSLQNQLSERNSLLTELNAELRINEENYNRALKQESERLAQLTQQAKQSEAAQIRDIKAKNKTISELNEKLQAQEAQLSMSKEELQVANELQIKEQEARIAELDEKVLQQQSTYQSTMAQLKAANDKNASLSAFRWLFFVFAGVAVIALAIAFKMSKKVKSLNEIEVPVSDNEVDTLLPLREQQLIKSESLAALGYIATDTSYAVGLQLEDFKAQLESSGDTKNVALLTPITTLIDTLNDIAADQDDASVQNFDLVAYVQKIISLYKFEFEQSDIEYNYSGEQSLSLQSIPSYIALAMQNVINNALKHGFDNNGNGSIRLKVEKDGKNGAKITFIDDGKGMNKDTLAKVFEPFFTTESKRGYTGAGMSSSYDLIKNKLSGDITIDSKEGQWTTVEIFLPSSK